jgi:hypothetical protein
MKHLMPNDPRHEISRSTGGHFKGVMKGLRTGLATCRFLYIASIGSAPSISLYGPYLGYYNTFYNSLISQIEKTFKYNK